MKQPAVQVDRRPNRKISKYKTETGEIEKRENRSNSVCNWLFFALVALLKDDGTAKVYQGHPQVEEERAQAHLGA